MIIFPLTPKNDRVDMRTVDCGVDNGRAPGSGDVDGLKKRRTVRKMALEARAAHTLLQYCQVMILLAM